MSIVQTRYTVVCATADGHSVAKSLSKMILTFAVVAVGLLSYRDRKVKDMCKMKKKDSWQAFNMIVQQLCGEELLGT